MARKCKYTTAIHNEHPQTVSSSSYNYPKHIPKHAQTNTDPKSTDVCARMLCSRGAAMNAQVVTIPHMFPGKQFYNDVREFDSLQDQTHPSKTQAGTKLPQEPPRKLQIARHAVHGHCQNGMLPWMTSFAISNRGASSHFSGRNTPSATVDRTDRPYHSWKVEKHHTACNEKNAVHEESRCVMHGQFL